MKLLKFYAPGCAQCKIQSLEFERNPINCPIEEINVEEEERYIDEYSLRNLPTCILLTDTGNLVHRFNGYIASAIINRMIDNSK